MSLCAARVAPEKAVFRPALPLHLRPEFTGEHMATRRLTFAEQIKHPKWQARRLEIMQQAGFRCQRCGETEVTLNVHHKRYVKGRMYWEYEDAELDCLCEVCHQGEHAFKDLLERILIEASGQAQALESAVALLAGFFAGDCTIAPALAKEAMDADPHTYLVGVLASIASRADWEQTTRAADAMRGDVMTPEQEWAYAIWSGQDDAKGSAA